MKRLKILLVVIAAIQVISGCAPAHLYPSYLGRVLEKGTDKPIEGAGVVAVYWKQNWVGIAEGGSTDYRGFQAALTDEEGRFKIPAKLYLNFWPLSGFKPYPLISIYKEGYGNFGGGFSYYGGKTGISNPKIPRTGELPPNTEVIFWLPKLETREELGRHKRAASRWLDTTKDYNTKFPPPGTTKEQFGY
ncbi:MAG: hypothetical protein P1S46_07535 [bacterium]|nr:hypothetical protein [bacterium]